MPVAPRLAIAQLPAYRPGKGAAQAEAEWGITDAIKLASNETPWEPVPAVVAAIRAAATGVNRYADHRAVLLRQSLGHSVGLSADQVTVGCGSVGLLQQLLLSYVEVGEEVIYPWRSFEAYPVYTQLVGAIPVTTPLIDGAFDLDAVAAAVTDKTKLILLANPNNPTGTAFDTAAARTLLERVPDRVLVVLDEAYREFVDSSLGDPVAELLGDFPNLVVLRTFSKAHGIAALRVGYGFGQPDVIAEIDKTLAPFAVNGVAQAAAIAALDAIDEVRERVGRLVTERDRVRADLLAAGLPIPDAHANFVYVPLGERTDAIALALEQRGVVTRPFSGEGIRVTTGTPEQNDRFLATFHAVFADN